MKLVEHLATLRGKSAELKSFVRKEIIPHYTKGENGQPGKLDVKAIKVLRGESVESLSLDERGKQARELVAEAHEAEVSYKAEVHIAAEDGRFDPGVSLDGGPRTFAAGRKAFLADLRESPFIKNELFRQKTTIHTLKDFGLADGIKARQQRQFFGHQEGEQFFKDGIKAQFATGSTDIADVRQPTIVQAAGVQRPTLLDALPIFSTPNQMTSYLEETTRTQPSKMASKEGTAFPEPTYVLSERVVQLVRVGAVLPITLEVKYFASNSEQHIRMNLDASMLESLESLFITGQAADAGNGAGAAFGGLAGNRGTKSGSQTAMVSTAKGSDTRVEAMIKAKYRIIAACPRANPNAHVLHPTDVGEMRLEKSADNYHMGTLGSIQGSTVPVIDGVPVIMTTRFTAGTGYIGDFANFAGIAVHSDLGLGGMMEEGYSGTQFVEGEYTLRVFTFAASWIRLGEAFQSVTAI